MNSTEAKQQDVKSLFKTNALMDYDFAQAPQMVRFKSDSSTEILGAENVDQWKEKQDLLMSWAEDRNVLVKETVEPVVKALDGFFQSRGNMRGDVLDIGGGWGLYREWWEPGNFYIVHDPGVERLMTGGPPPAEIESHPKARHLPAVFIEGFGEDLPYRDEVFDTCLIAAALDHCVDPQKIFSEVARCLKPKGTLLLIQDYHDPKMIKHRVVVLRLVLSTH